MSPSITSLLCPILAACHVYAQESYSQLPSTAIPNGLLTPSGSYATNYDFGTTSNVSGSVGAINATTFTSTTASLIGITGVPGPSTLPSVTASTRSTTTRPSQPINTQPCNGYVEFCNRSLGNISMVVAHNSPFVIPRNAASNQALGVITQLNDGIRGLQFETQMPNDILRLCHTSCNLLDAGTLQAYLQKVAGWLAANPYEVIAIMMGNTDRVSPTNYIQPFEAAGLLPYLYTPTASTYSLDQWPTLAQMILSNKRVVVMLDYGANQEEVSWLLDQFRYQWQTPFSPTDTSFPCTAQRPPNQPEDVSRNKMYMLNHNLNIAITLNGNPGDAFLIPAYTLLNEVNADSGNTTTLGGNVANCTAMWNRPPNWLLVDYYNFGNFNGSVFQVAANANNVSYNRNSCCGTESNSGAKSANLMSTATLLLLNLLLLFSLW
ncbi:PLC-like phosphodiesterase [Polyplosphaeria fusca]|uniref:PLC-like phosphodiesterase n=1 Tax=Polyplosphaeria fusca TaxID=682080 RepID=A0A9P4V8L2_9PLEO|nr:PLC-like phosphodiesterase [Polyplosphaeria fusca]